MQQLHQVQLRNKPIEMRHYVIIYFRGKVRDKKPYTKRIYVEITNVRMREGRIILNASIDTKG